MPEWCVWLTIADDRVVKLNEEYCKLSQGMSDRNFHGGGKVALAHKYGEMPK
jgi:hypothetical protein